MAVEGSLDLFSLPEILQMISQQGKTGILTIQGQQDIVAISFLGGRIVAADSLAHTVEERLGKVLVSEGLLGAPELARANAENLAAGGRLLDLLVERGYLSRQQLLAALRLQTIRHLEDLLHWQAGDFKFYSGDEVSYEEGFEPISVEDLLLRHLEDFSGSAAPPPAAAAGPRLRPLASPAPPIPMSLPRPSPVTPVAAVDSRIAPAAPPPPPWAPALTPAAPPTAAGDRGSEAVGALGAGGSGAGAPGSAQPAGGARTDSGELWMPQLPELPEAPVSPATRPGTSSAAAPSLELLGGTGSLAPPSSAALPSPPSSSSSPSSLPSSLPPPAFQPPWGAATASLPSPAPAIPPAAAAGAAAAAAGWAPTAAAAGEPLPWPAAVMSPPPSPPPARPRPSGARVVKRAGSPSAAAATGTAAGGPAGAAAVSPPVAGGSPGVSPIVPLIPPDGAAAAARARSAAAPAGRGAQGAPSAALSLDGTASPAVSRQFRQMRVERPERAASMPQRVAAAGLALGAAVSLAVAAWRAPQSVLLPFPWQQEERAALVRNQRESLFDKIDGAAKTAFLRDGRFPDQLVQLRDAGLLSPADLDDPGGEPLRYSAREDGYTLQATESGRPLPDADTGGSIAGNFLLDPSLLQRGAASGPPIVLLD
jgi:hypothetical protein